MNYVTYVALLHYFGKLFKNENYFYIRKVLLKHRNNRNTATFDTLISPMLYFCVDNSRR